MTRSLHYSEIASGLSLLTPEEKRGFVLVLISSLLNGLLQTFALAGVLPFIQSMMSPESATRTPWGRWLQEAFGFISPAGILTVVGFCLLGLVIAKNLYGWFQTGWQSRFAAKCEQRLARDILDEFLQADFAWNTRQNSSVIRDIIMNNVVLWCRGFLRTLIQLSNDLFFVVSTVAFLILISPKSGLAVFFATGFLAWGLVRLTRPRLLYSTGIKREASYRAGSLCSEAISGVREIKMAGSGKVFIADFSREFSKYSFAESHVQQWSSLPRQALEALGYASLISIALIITWRSGDNKQAVSLIALYGVATIRLLPVFGSAISTLNKLTDTLPLIKDITRIREEAACGRASDALVPYSKSDSFTEWREIAFEDVSYRYEGNTKFALEGLNARIRRGESLGIVGPSGSGKSTFADILSALLTPTEGRLLVGDRAVHGKEDTSWRSRIGYVSQNPFLLDATLAENIIFNQGAPDLDRLRDAVRAAHLESVVSRLPDGLETRLGERGVRLSGGQRQRVAIARALYRSAELLILDEATSALDTVSEQEVTEAIRQLAGTVTVIVIAHRLSTVRQCNKIMVLEGGRITGLGSHEELLASSPTYQTMVSVSGLTPTP